MRAKSMMARKLKRCLVTALAFALCCVLLNVKLKLTSTEFVPSIHTTKALRTTDDGRTSNHSVVRRKREPVFPSETTNIVVLSSGPRSGSTFLGELVSLPPSTFYFYEPRHMMAKGSFNKETLPSELHRLFNCHFSGLNFTSARRVFRTMRHSATYKCSKISCPSPTEQRMQKLCFSAKNRVLKTVRMPLDWIKNIVEDPSENVKLIHLVRDPRGSFPSARKLGYAKAPAYDRCHIIEQDLDASALLERRHPDKFIRVTYEQLCLQPWDITKELYHFIAFGNKAVCSSPHVKTATDTKILGPSSRDNLKNAPVRLFSPSRIRDLHQQRNFASFQIAHSSRKLIEDSVQNGGGLVKGAVDKNQAHKSDQTLTYYSNLPLEISLNARQRLSSPAEEEVHDQSYIDEEISRHDHQAIPGQNMKFRRTLRRTPSNNFKFSKEMSDRLELPSYVLDHLSVHLRPNILTSDRRDPHSTVRDHKSVYKVWRRVLTLQDLQTLQEVCRGVITKLNHAFFDCLVDLRNVTRDYVLSRWVPRSLDPC